MSLTSIITIKKNTEFQSVFEKGHSIQSRYLVVYFLPKQDKISRYGFCVGKKLGNAVTRNRIKRLMREVVRNTRNDVMIGKDIILLARTPILKASFDQILKDYQNILTKVTSTLINRDDRRISQ